MCMLNAVAHQSSMQELDLLNPQLDPRISYSGGPKMFFGSNGLLQESPGNYLLQSEDFNNAVWLKDQATVVANAAIGPFGGATADKLIPSTTNTSSHRVYQDVTTAAIAHTDSVYAKAAGYAVLSLTNYSGRCTVNLADGSVIETSGAPEAFAVTPAPNGYWRIEIAKTPVAGVIRTQIAIYPTPDRASYSGDGVSGVLVCAAMKNKGATAAAYLATTSAPAYDWPVEYDPITLQPLGRSVWEQRTNLLLWSNDPSNAVWTKSNFTVTPNALTVKGINFFKLEAVATGLCFQGVAGAGSALGNTWSFLIKKGNGKMNRFTFRNDTTAPNNFLTFEINLDTGAITYFTGSTGVTAVDIGDGVWSVRVFNSANIMAGDTLRIYIGAGSGVTQTPGDYAYMANMQLEVGAFASPYIPTAGSQVTRVADVAKVEGVASLRFNPSAGVLMADFSIGGESGAATPAHVCGFADATDNAVFRASAVYDNRLSVGFLAPAANIPQYADMTGARVKVAQSYVGGASLTGVAAAIDGVSRTASWNGAGSLNTSTIGRLAIGWSGRSITVDRFMAGWVRTIRYYPSQLAVAEQQALTT